MHAFTSRDIGTPTYSLGLHLNRDLQRRTLIVSQRQCVARLAEQRGVANANPVVLPMEPGSEPHPDGNALL